MAIKLFIQGEKNYKDQELFGLIGHWLVDMEVHEKLGTAITAKEGDIWYVSVTGKGEVRGFANSRAMSNDALHVRYIYCVEKADMVCKALIKKAINQAKNV